MNPIVNRLIATRRDPITITGRLLPHLDLELSAITPIIGCTIMPEMGPANQTIEVWPFVNPRERRYGVQSADGLVSLSSLNSRTGAQI